MSLNTIKKGTLEYLAAPGISTPHCFTTRLGGVSAGINSSLNLALNSRDTPENVSKNLHLLARELGFRPEKLVMTRQTHSDIVRVVTEKDAKGLCHRDYPECDGLATCTPGVALLVFTADCTPILLNDPVTGAVGAVHAGWRGTASAIAVKCAQAMCENFGCQMENIHAAIDKIHAKGKKAGIVLKPKTPAEAVLPYLEKVELILVMTVEPGFGGQAFMESQLETIRQVRAIINKYNPACELEVDGGIAPNTAPLVVEAGANVLVAGSSVYGAQDVPAAIQALRG